MKLSARRILMITLAALLLTLTVATTIWFGAIEGWLLDELHARAAAHLNPTLSIDELSYRFPRTVILRGVRLASADPESARHSVEIVAIDSLTLVLSSIPWPDEPFRMQRFALTNPTLRLVRSGRKGQPRGWLGFSNLLRERSDSRVKPADPPATLSDQLQAWTISIEDGRVEYDPRAGNPAIMSVEGIHSQLALHPAETGIYGVEFSLDHRPALELELRGQLHADDRALEVSRFRARLNLSRKHDHYLMPSLQRLLAKLDVTGLLTLEASGAVDFRDLPASRLEVRLELSHARYAIGPHKLALDKVDSHVALRDKTVTVKKLEIDALGGHASIVGTVDLADSLASEFVVRASDLQIADVLRGAVDPDGVPNYSGLLGLTSTLQGPLNQIGRQASGKGRLTLQKARIGRLPVLSTIDEALDRAAEAFMKRERVPHDQLSLDFSFDGDHAHITKLRMNSRWYGLRGHGDAYFDSRLDLAVDGGPIQKLENEIGRVGDVLGEITETLVRARVTGTAADPEIGIELLRQHRR
jgi:hypothetical protein